MLCLHVFAHLFHWGTILAFNPQYSNFFNCSVRETYDFHTYLCNGIKENQTVLELKHHNGTGLCPRIYVLLHPVSS